MTPRSIAFGLALAAFLSPNFAAPARSSAQNAQAPPSSVQARAELDTGSQLTRAGMLRQAIPHLLAAQKSGIAPYAVSVNLGICYLGTNQYPRAIATLEALRKSGTHTPTVDNLLAQAYLGENRPQAALAAFRRAAAATPKSEKLYAYMADACTDHQDYALGLRITEIGLRQLPGSARLHYERALFLARLDRFNQAKPEFETAARLAPNAYIGTLALVQENLYEDNLKVAAALLRKAVRAGHRDYQTLSLLGSVLLFEGAAPGQPEFAEAQSALEESARDRPDYPETQIELGKLYLREGQYADAAAHLEIGLRLEPNNPAVCAGLANAYRRLGKKEQARQLEQRMARLLAEKKTEPLQPHP